MIAALLLPSDLVLPGERASSSDTIRIRRATIADLDAVVGFLYDDPISRGRGDEPDPADQAAYRQALREIAADARNELVVAENHAGDIVGCLQLTTIPGLSRRGATRLLVEAVRVAPALRSSGIGSALMTWVTQVAAPATGAARVQLTCDAARVDARRFYLRQGFTDSHIGFTHRVEA